MASFKSILTLGFIFPKDAKNNKVDVAPWGTAQTLTSTTVAAHTNAYEENTLVRIKAKGDCHVKIGVNAVAVANTCTYMSEGDWEYQPVAAGERISVLGANVNITDVRLL